ncbi:DNA-protecting protein DprA [Paraburkholderia aspalathi]|nr:DNA-protecting protein DprA [Paraburkholderia aspalathi]
MNESANSKLGIRLSDRQRLNWLRLIRSDNIGPSTFRDLILHCGSAGNAIDMLPELSRRGGGRKPVRIASIEAAERELEHINRLGAQLIGMGEPEYPPYLKKCSAPPPLVTIKGDTAVFAKPPVAIVGARNASVIGVRFTQSIVAELGDAGFAIVSGLARGIDAAAHRQSLGTGTIAVLAGGLDKPYPPENLPLYREIPERGGVLISEMPMGWVPRAQDFPRRNRIIAGISLGLLVVEAAERSGSLISARLAGEMGRLVFAVPGSPLDPRASGTNALLKQGAIMVTHAGDVIESLAPLTRQTGTFDLLPEQPLLPIFEEEQDLALIALASDNDRDQVVDALGPVPVDMDMIIRHTGLNASELHLILLELDLAGRLIRYPGGKIALYPESV